MILEVLRLGHRPQRDKRITTHVCLTARAMGARRVRISETDESVVKSVRDVASRFGGSFEVESGTGWKGPVKKWKEDGGIVIHLTMYGKQMHEAVAQMDGNDRPVMVVVGAEKVPAEIYDLADHNVAVGNQPHSEVAALALMLDRLREGSWENDEFPDAEVEVLPNERGKTVRGPGSAPF